MAPRQAYVHPSALSPAEYEAYSSWTDELDSQITKLGRGLRFGEMLAFIRKRTPVDREAEIMTFFGSIPQQQSLGIGEFIAILRLLAHARTCATLTRDHIFIQTHPLVLSTDPPPCYSNPFFKPSAAYSGGETRLQGPQEVNLRDAAATKKRVPPPAIAAGVLSKSNGATTSPITPRASSMKPFRPNTTPASPVSQLSKVPTQPAVSAESVTTAKSPPLPPRPSSLPKQPPPKHVSQLSQGKADGTQTPTMIKAQHVPALGPTSLDIISSSLQPNDTGHSNASSSAQQQPGSNSKLTSQPTGSRKAAENAVRLLGSSHIGVDAKPLRAKPPPARHSSSSEDFMLHQNASDSSLSSLAGMLPRTRRDTLTSTIASTANTDDQEGRQYPYAGQEGPFATSGYTSSGATVNANGQTTLKGLVVKSTPPLPPPPRRRPESLYTTANSTARAQQLVFGSTPTTGHPAPYSATSIRSSPAKHRTNSMPYVSHGRAASLAGSSHSQPVYGRPLAQTAQGLNRRASISNRSKPLDGILWKGRDVSQEWLQKARAGVLGHTGEDKEGLIAADEVAYTAADARENDSDSDASDPDVGQRRSVNERRRELERMRTEDEPGWARLD